MPPSSSNTARAAPAGPKPLFGVEIEIYVKVLPSVEDRIRAKQRSNYNSLPEHWRYYDFDLKNGTGNVEGKAFQRKHVGNAIQSIIDTALGSGNGWHCEADASLKEYQLEAPPDPRKWWGIEIISPPLSVATEWQEEIETVFAAVGKQFDFWTNECCACHVHVSPGPKKSNKYTSDQLVKMAKGAYFWEDALCDLIPPERRQNRYANANWTVYATDEYRNVQYDGWGPIFSKLSTSIQGRGGLENFIYLMKGGANETRYISTSFAPFERLGTVELRRQAGAASAYTVIQRVLLAVTFHVSALRYDFAGAASRRDVPYGDELIRELAGCIKKLPDTCHGYRFVAWLKWCLDSYEDEKFYTEKQINSRERALRRGDDPPDQRSSRPGLPAPRASGGRPPSSASASRPPARSSTRPPASGRRSPSPRRPLAGSRRNRQTDSGRDSPDERVPPRPSRRRDESPDDYPGYMNRASASRPSRRRDESPDDYPRPLTHRPRLPSARHEGYVEQPYPPQGYPPQGYPPGYPPQGYPPGYGGGPY
ncbi:putative amidoligase enzyme-domain-containing protein [Dichotomopilus funicola]|uniref:Rhodopsin n=1 Tax=Dichotomopilus funicola TaxID=1934379 RepID=A0AAN6ZPU1_9PEZI|nr:putative amidoligase enzyme-domain-containing protein [Dichotomopilus funicola]